MPSSASQLLTALNSYGIQKAQSITSGNIWFVDGNAAQAVDSYDGEHGYSWDMPFATLDYAIGACSVDDIIYVAESHAETLAAEGSVTIDVEGVRVIGLGNGSNRPLFSIGATGVATASMIVSAANVWIENIQFRSIAVGPKIQLDINSDNCTVKNCFFNGTDSTATYYAETSIDINGGGANACDRTSIIDCEFRGLVAGGLYAIELGEVAEGVLISGCLIIGDYATAAIHNPTGKVLTNLVIKDCIIVNSNAGDWSIELVSACTGVIANCYNASNALATSIDPGSCYCFECYTNHAVDKNGLLTPGVDS